jgi:hypothetical protein
MRKGVAEAIRIKAGQDKTVYDWIREAHGHGARFFGPDHAGVAGNGNGRLEGGDGVRVLRAHVDEALRGTHGQSGPREPVLRKRWLNPAPW